MCHTPAGLEDDINFGILFWIFIARNKEAGMRSLAYVHEVLGHLDRKRQHHAW
jgi:hypothetical protein